MAYLPNRSRTYSRPYRLNQAQPSRRSMELREKPKAKNTRAVTPKRHARPKLGLGIVKLIKQLLDLLLHTPNRPASDVSAFDSSLPKRSRLQRRIQTRPTRDRVFLKIVRRKRAQLGPLRKLQLRKILNRHRAKYKLWQALAVFSALCTTLGGVIWTNLFIQEKVTFAGVPYRIINKFWNDKPARDAYFVGDRQALHDRLKTLDVEADIKDYYRDRFANEHELDRYIHQLMFDRTGYVGEAYKVDNFGELTSKKSSKKS